MRRDSRVPAAPAGQARCRVCATKLDRVLVRQGQYTHPCCDPQLPDPPGRR